MSRFYGSLQGARGEATRQGHAGSGLVGHVRGWDLGVRVTAMTHSADDGRDAFVVDITGGSNGNERTRYGVLQVSDAGDGWRRLTVSADPQGFVCYLPPDGGPAVSRKPSPPEEALRDHVTGAIERGEAEPVVEVRADA